MNKIKIMAAALLLFAQSQAQDFWSVANETSIRVQGKRQIVPQKYLTTELNTADMKSKLFSAPHEKDVRINNSICIISLPLPNGTFQRFKVVESPIMASELAASFPNIKTFLVKGIDDPYANGKLDWAGNTGFHGMVRTPNGDFFIDPYSLNDTTHYITYYTADFIKNPSDVLPEVGVIENEENEEQKKPTTSLQETNGNVNKTTAVICVGSELRKYRLAIGCTGQYAVAATGMASPTTADVLNKVITTVNRVGGVYESEVAIRFELVPTTTLSLYLKTNTTSSIVPAPTATAQSYSGNNNANTLISESHSVITTLVGSSNFDIGHTFSTGGGGLAMLQSVCKVTQKGRGITGSPNPVGDPYDIDYVAHEIGHQFGGNHTFNANSSSCSGNRNPSTSVEPGSGITVMGYAGICGTNNLAAHSIPYFHTISYDEIVNYSNSSTGNSCATIISTGNQAPVVTAAVSYVVPASTPFYLTGSAYDPDNDDLTYSWEETDLGSSGGNWNSGNKPFFRSYEPTISSTRLFPNQTVVLSGNYTGTKGEYLPKTAQTLNFRLTARDNKANGGGVCYDHCEVTVDASSSFSVTYPNTAGIYWGSESQQTVVWDVNNTDVPPVDCGLVDIYISLDGGNTYSLLVSTTPNDGSEIITAPSVTTSISTCRIKVESIGNIFYDVSDKNFTLTNELGIHEISTNNAMGLSVYPNPSHGKFTIAASNLNASHETKVVVQTILGKTIFETSYNNKTELNETLDLSNFGQGMYFVKVSNDSKQSVYRVIKD